MMNFPLWPVSKNIQSSQKPSNLLDAIPSDKFDKIIDKISTKIKISKIVNSSDFLIDISDYINQLKSHQPAPIKALPVIKDNPKQLSLFD